MFAKEEVSSVTAAFVTAGGRGGNTRSGRARAPTEAERTSLLPSGRCGDVPDSAVLSATTDASSSPSGSRDDARRRAVVGPRALRRERGGENATATGRRDGRNGSETTTAAAAVAVAAAATTTTAEAAAAAAVEDADDGVEEEEEEEKEAGAGTQFAPSEQEGGEKGTDTGMILAVKTTEERGAEKDEEGDGGTEGLEGAKDDAGAAKMTKTKVEPFEEEGKDEAVQPESVRKEAEEVDPVEGEGVGEGTTQVENSGKGAIDSEAERDLSEAEVESESRALEAEEKAEQSAPQQDSADQSSPEEAATEMKETKEEEGKEEVPPQPTSFERVVEEKEAVVDGDFQTIKSYWSKTSLRNTPSGLIPRSNGQKSPAQSSSKRLL
mmetsp:Transcript_6774/g.14152  ORF Transcript_6774/g.14152 Transcript_6774/m.14152 type:complete len:381 (-) Transcript_6774:56-1198(-)